MGLFDKILGKAEEQIQEKIQEKLNINTRPAAIVDAHKVDIDANVFRSMQQKYVAFDVETTGLNAYCDRIVELGAVVFEGGEIVRRFSTLVDPKCLIPEAASRVNHITNDMLRRAPKEEQVYPELVNFLGEALHGDVIICAHNAKFDMGFLTNTLERLGFSCDIRFVDTLAISRKQLRLADYKQDTVAKHFGFVNENAHRAVTDAEICGKIMWELLGMQEKGFLEQEKKAEAKKLTEEELEVCAVIQNAILRRGGSSEWLRFYKNSNGYVDVVVASTILKFKYATKGHYIVIPSSIKTPAALPVEKCSVNEGGTSFIRMYFSSPFNIEFLGDYFFSIYENALNSMYRYFKDVPDAKYEVEQNIKNMPRIMDADLEPIIKAARMKQYIAVPENITVKKSIGRDEVVVNAVNNRCPLQQVLNYGDSDKGFKDGFPYYEDGEEARLRDELDKAIALFDLARQMGYDAPALYDSYAKAYRKLKDYENEIEIIEEYFLRNPDIKHGEFEARRDKAVELLYKVQCEEKKKKEKALLDKQKKAANSDAKESEPKRSTSKAIIQMDDDGNMIAEYESVSVASKTVGVSEKCIRDTAKGVQKHAGGFVWKYKE